MCLLTAIVESYKLNAFKPLSSWVYLIFKKIQKKKTYFDVDKEILKDGF